MQVEAVIAELAERRGRSAWEHGVIAYAMEMLENLDPGTELRTPTVRNTLLNGAPSWHDYSWGGCALVYDRNIAERLCTPSELKRSDYGRLRPNSREEWLDAQARACSQASRLVERTVRAHEGGAPCPR